MKPEDPIWNFCSALNDEINTSVKCLDCSAEVSATVLRLMMGTLGRYIQSTLVISTSVISNNRLSRRENLILV